jgi:signal transduction histidine kinase
VNSRLARLLPRRIAAQIMLVMLVVFVVMVLFFGALFRLLPHAPPDAGSANSAIKAGVAVSRLNEAPAAERERLLREMTADNVGVTLALIAEGDLPSVDQREKKPPFWAFMPGEVGDGIKLALALPGKPDGNSEPAPVLFFRLKDGAYVRAGLPSRPPPLFVGGPMVSLLIFVFISIVLLLLWVTRTLVRPLSGLSEAVSSFGLKSTAPVPLDETGPAEVQEVARAFNRMQGRIQDLIERRTRMLAAIGHDLRTPITRLRLRIDLMADEEHKQRNLADLDQMEAQLNGAITFLREGRTGEASMKIDLPSLLQSLVDQYEDMGVAVAMTCETGLAVQGRPSELNRALANLIDNARRYDDRISMTAVADGDMVVLEVVDHGPGIPAGERTRMMEPFERGEEERPLDQGVSFGLGLATSAAIAEAHGGSLELLDTPGGGLTARIHLPKA